MFFIQSPAGVKTPGSSGLRRSGAIRAPRRPPPKAPVKRKRARTLSYRRRVAAFPEEDLSLKTLTLEQLAEKLGYPSVEAMEHSEYRQEVRDYHRKCENPQKYGGIPNRPVRSYHHAKKPCEFSGDENSSSGEESDSEIDNALLKKINVMLPSSKLFENVSPEPLDESFVDDDELPPLIDVNPDDDLLEGIDLAKIDADVAAAQEDVAVNAAQNIEQFDDNAVADVLDGSGRPIVGLSDTSEYLTSEQGNVKLRHLGAEFWESPGIFPTFCLAGNKFVSCSFSPAAARDLIDPYGLKLFFLHSGRATQFSDPKSGAVPLSTAALRDLVIHFDSFVAHARSKASLVTVIDEKTGKNKHLAANPLKDLKLGGQVRCPHSGNYGQVWVRFVHAQNGDPLCVIDFVHHRVACDDDGRRPIKHTNFVVQVQTIFHFVKNVFPLMNEFQMLVCEKARSLVDRFAVQLPEFPGTGRVVVNDVTVNPNVSWEYGSVVLE